jgi:hypothetical protein
MEQTQQQETDHRADRGAVVMLLVLTVLASAPAMWMWSRAAADALQGGPVSPQQQGTLTMWALLIIGAPGVGGVLGAAVRRPGRRGVGAAGGALLGAVLLLAAGVFVFWWTLTRTDWMVF